MEETTSVKLLLLTLERIDKHINLANIKASLLLPANAVFLGQFLSHHKDLFAPFGGTKLSWIPPLASVIIIVSTILSTSLAMLVIKSYLGSGARRYDYWPLLFFGSISKMKLESYLENVSSVTEDSFRNDLASQVHLLSGSLKTKFKLVNWSLAFLLIPFLLLAVLLISKILIG